MTAVDDRSTTDDGAAHDGGEEPPRKVARYVALGVGVVLALFIGLLATRPSGDQGSAANALVGKRVPALSGTTLDGSTVSIDSFRGQWVLVNFVAEWCQGCIDEHGDLKAFAEAHRDDVQVIGVAYDSRSLDELRAFFAKAGGDWPVIGSDDGRSAIDFAVTAVPESFLVAPSGLVVAHAEGVTREWLEDVLAQGKALAASQSTTTPASVAGR